MPNPQTSAAMKIQRCLRPQAMNRPYPCENRTMSLRRRTDDTVMLRLSGNLSSNDGTNSSAMSRDTARLTTITSEKSVRLACCSSGSSQTIPNAPIVISSAPRMETNTRRSR